jgi:hypothetical protein
MFVGISLGKPRIKKLKNLLYLVGAHTIIHIRMSLIPSNSLVEVKLSQLREERVATLTAFRLAVEEARIGWEAELILALEEFRDAGGFAAIQEGIRAAKQSRVGRIRDDHFMSNSSSSTPIHQIKEERWRLVFHPDVLDIKLALQQSYSSTLPPDITGDPTMVSERANFRYNYLKGVNEELRLACQTEADRQEARDMAFLESRRAAQKEEAEVRQRLGRGTLNYYR